MKPLWLDAIVSTLIAWLCQNTTCNCASLDLRNVPCAMFALMIIWASDLQQFEQQQPEKCYADSRITARVARALIDWRHSSFNNLLGGVSFYAFLFSRLLSLVCFTLFYSRRCSRCSRVGDSLKYSHKHTQLSQFKCVCFKKMCTRVFEWLSEHRSHMNNANCINSHSPRRAQQHWKHIINFRTHIIYMYTIY